MDTASQGDWDVVKNNRKKTKKKVQLKATRQSSRLRGHGGIPVEELATKRKQKHHMDMPVMKLGRKPKYLL
jgi:hypothetical protein